MTAHNMPGLMFLKLMTKFINKTDKNTYPNDAYIKV